MNNTPFNVRIYSQGATVAASEIKSDESDYYTTKHLAIEAVKRIIRENQMPMGGEVIKLNNGHYRTVAVINEKGELLK